MTSKNIFDFLHFSHPTTEQAAVLKAMEKFVNEDSQDDFFILCGAAGTGKTSITAALIGYLDDGQMPYRIAAPTGRAARILGRKANTTTSTILSLIYNIKTEAETGKVHFSIKSRRDNHLTVSYPFLYPSPKMYPSPTMASADSLP